MKSMMMGSIRLSAAPMAVDTSSSKKSATEFNIVGIDPRRNAILLPEEVKPGARVRFALRDAVAARENLEALVTKQIVPGCALGIYVSGSSLDYAGADGAGRDARCFDSHDPEVPVLGLRGAQVLGPPGDLETDCAALNDCGLLVVVEH